jgi:uncharacterized protein YbaP (TraB family)
MKLARRLRRDGLVKTVFLMLAGLCVAPLAGLQPALAASLPHGFVYRVTSPAAGSTLYLYGTVHVGRSNGAGLDPETVALIATCRHVALELDPRNKDATKDALKRYAVYTPPDHLGLHVPADLDRRALTEADTLQLPRTYAEQIRPWMLANFLSVFSLKQSGYDPARSSETLLAAEAGHAHADLIEIEGADQQMKLIGGAPDDVQVDALAKTVEQIESGHIADEASSLLTAWENSDVKAIDRILAELTGEPGPYPKFMAEEVLGARNRTMADAAEKQIASSGDTLFAVGVLHLLGADGLVAELRRRGYSVTALSSN